MWREEQNIFCQEVDVVKNKNLEGVTVDSCRQKPDVIWETLRACYFRSTSLSRTRFLFFTKALRFKRRVKGSPMICALMISSLRPSACFIYDKRARVIYCSFSWHWYIFETSSLSDRINFIMFPVANEKQRLSVALIKRRFV